MEYAKTVQQKLIEISHKDCKKMIFITAIFAVLMLASYGFLVTATVSSMVAYGEAKSNIAEINSRLSDLEYRYTTLSRSLTEEKALSNGLVLNSNSHFIVLNPETKSSLADAETVVR